MTSPYRTNVRPPEAPHVEPESDTADEWERRLRDASDRREAIVNVAKWAAFGLASVVVFGLLLSLVAGSVEAEGRCTAAGGTLVCGGYHGSDCKCLAVKVLHP